MSRRKGQALNVPGSAEEAVALIGAYVAGERVALDARLRTETAIDRLKGDRDAVLAAIDAEQKTRFSQLKAWWEAGGSAAARGRRSAELAGARLGTRITPPALKLPKGRAVAEVMSDLMAWLGGDFIRTRHELDKPAIITALRKQLGEDAPVEQLHDRRVLADELKLSVVQKDEFFIDCGLERAAEHPGAGTPAIPSNQEQ